MTKVVDVERLMALAGKPKKLHEHFANKVGCVEIDAMRGDNLAVCLCSFFEDPDEAQDGETGWGDSATSGYELTRDAIHEVYAPSITALCEEVATLRSMLGAFMGADEKLQVGVGGNPAYVDSFLKEVRAILPTRRDVTP